MPGGRASDRVGADGRVGRRRSDGRGDRELRADTAAQQRYREAAAGNDPDVVPVWAGQAVDLIATIEPAGDLVATIAADAERALTRPRMAH